MRLASFALCVGGTSVLAATVQSINAKVEKAKDDPVAATGVTYFDGMQVPALLQLTADNSESEFNRTKYMVVNYGR